jgi:hypothetical protein
MTDLGRGLSFVIAAAALFGPAAHAQVAAGDPGGLRGVSGLAGAAGNAPVPAVGGPSVAGMAASGNPYLGGAVAGGPYSNGGYALSTVPGGMSGMGGLGGYSGMGLPGPGGLGYGGYSYVDPNSQYLLGLSAMTVATGRYYKDIMTARITRERSRQMALDTARKRIQFEAWYESLKPRTQDLVDSAVRTELDESRKDPPMTKVWSGATLNSLLNSIRKMGRLSRGPNISLEEDTLKHVNLASPAMPGSVGMLRDGGKITWPLGLKEKQFDDRRDRLARNLESAVDAIKGKGDVEASRLKDINNDFDELRRQVNDSQDELPITQYLEARRFMTQLGDAIRALRDPKIKNYFNNTWNAKGRNVSELVDNMTRDGLVFAPAAPGDEAAYSALYYALRNFEAGLALAQK